MPAEGIAQVLSHLPQERNSNLLVGTETRDDAGVYRIAPDIALVQTIDFFPPVVDDPFIYGQIAASNALSDVYAMGGKPITALNLVGYPDDRLDLTWLGQILRGGAERCQAAGCSILGGHTVRDAEIKFGLSVTGVVHPDRIITNAGARSGDLLVLTKPLGTGFVTTAAKRKVCPDQLLEAACTSMVRLNDRAAEAMIACQAHSATDITGFGLAGHAMEMAEGSKVTIRLALSKLPLLTGIETLPISRHLTRGSKSNFDHSASITSFAVNLDPFRKEFLYDPQTSGGLLIAVAPDRVNSLIEQLKAAGELTAVQIGEVIERKGNLALIVEK